MEIKDREAWKAWVDKNQDPYGKAVIDYAKRWADLMEERMANGENLEEIAKETSNEANTDGITGYMYGAAISVLHTSWKHGEQLRCWHNIDIQIKDEGEKANEKGTVLNPAILSIGK